VERWKDGKMEKLSDGIEKTWQSTTKEVLSELRINWVLERSRDGVMEWWDWKNLTESDEGGPVRV